MQSRKTILPAAIAAAMAAAIGAFGLHAETPSVVAIRNARIVPVSGPEIPSGTIIIRNGLIEAVGPQVPEPPDAWVLSGEGLTVYPGLIDALSSLGMPTAGAPVRGNPQGPVARGPEDRPLTFSHEKAADLFTATGAALESARNAGFTTAAVFPDRGIFGGQGAVMNLSGLKPGQMVVQSPAGMLVTLRNSGFGGGFPASLMGAISYVRQLYLDAAHYKAANEFYAANPVGNKRPDYDRTLDGLLASPRVMLPAQDAKEAARMIGLARELKLEAVLYGMHRGYEAALRLKESQIPVIISLKWPEAPRDQDPDSAETYRALELRDRAPSTPAELAKAGVRFAFSARGVDRPSELAAAVRKALDAGLPPAAALRAMTLDAAQILGVANRLGSIEKGKIANLVVTQGELFRTRTNVRYVFVDGVKFEPTPDSPPSAPEATQ